MHRSPFGLVLALSACGTPTSSLQPHIAAIWDGGAEAVDSLFINASFYTIDGSKAEDVPLANGHSVTATYRGQTVALDPSDFGSTPKSSAMFTFIPIDPAQPPDGQSITVALHGDGNDASASFTMPDSFTVEPTSVPTSVSRAMPITVRWSPVSDDTMMFSVIAADTDNSSCGGFTLPDPSTSTDTGAYTFSSNTISAEGICMLELDVWRVRYGTAPSEFHSGGEILGYQTRRIVFASTP
jgi:hypothetical protein